MRGPSAKPKSKVEAQRGRGRPGTRLLIVVGQRVRQAGFLDPGPIRAAHKHDRRGERPGRLVLFHRPAMIGQRDVAVYYSDSQSLAGASRIGELAQAEGEGQRVLSVPLDLEHLRFRQRVGLLLGCGAQAYRVAVGRVGILAAPTIRSQHFLEDQHVSLGQVEIGGAARQVRARFKLTASRGARRKTMPARLSASPSAHRW